jgi:hypothetical protein
MQAGNKPAYSRAMGINVAELLGFAALIVISD